MKKYKHSGDVGDLIYSLPVVDYHGEGFLYLNENGLSTQKSDGSKAGFNVQTVKMLKPLLLKQPYIIGVESWIDQEFDIDLDHFREVHRREQNLCRTYLKVFDVPYKDKQWLFVEKKRVAKKVFTRSFRYRNKKVDYRPFIEEDSIFLGLEEEWQNFCDLYGEINHHPIEDFWEAACIINGADVLIGNQNAMMAIAIALGKSFKQEVFISAPNCIFDRENAEYLTS